MFKNSCLDIEYICELNNAFIIEFDKNKNRLDYKILKSQLLNRETAINIVLELSNNKQVHKRVNKKIYKELIYKLNKYIDKLNKNYI